MSINFAVAGNSCSCFAIGRASPNAEAEYYYKAAASHNDMVVKKAIVTKEVVESAIRPTSHLGKAIENISIGIKERFSKNSTEKDKTREKTIAIAEKNLIQESLLPKKNTNEWLIDFTESPKVYPKKYSRFDNAKNFHFSNNKRDRLLF